MLEKMYVLCTADRERMSEKKEIFFVNIKKYE